MKNAFIVNSLAVSRNISIWGKIKAGLEKEPCFPYDSFFTNSSGHATSHALNAALSGSNMVIAVGGDGTVNEVLNGIFQSDKTLNHNIKLGTIPLGSGCDFARTLGIPRDPLEMVNIIKNGSIKRIDIGKTVFTNFDGKTETRYFINIADLGAGGVVVQKARTAPWILGKRPNYLWAILSVAISYKVKNVRISIDNGHEGNLQVRNLIIANGKYFGFGFKPAPQAEINDGVFDIINLGNFGLLESLWNMRRLRNGTHLSLKKVNEFHGCKIAAYSDDQVLLEVDGELIGTLPATFEIIPRAIDFVLP